MVKIRFPKINLSNTVFLVLALLLFMLLALTYYSPPKPAYASLDVKDLPNLFVEAAQGLNYSTRLLSSALKGSPVNASSHIHRMGMVAALLINACELPELWSSELGEQLREAAVSYAYAASAAADIASAAEDISTARYELREFLEGVRRCDFLKAHKGASVLERELQKALPDMHRALVNLARVDNEALLSDSHKRIHHEAIKQVSQVAKALENLLIAAKLVQLTDVNALEKACLMREPVNFSSDIIEVALKLKPGESGEFGYEVALLKSYVLSECEQCSGSNLNQNDKQGDSGAGWGEPGGDD
ncbi:MAG: hypothetical protein QW291_01600 [Thermofilaceae archaeon]